MASERIGDERTLDQAAPHLLKPLELLGGLHPLDDGTRYIYRVFRSSVLGRSDTYVTFPTPGNNIVSLQTCTPIPTFEERLVVQAELAEVDPA